MRSTPLLLLLSACAGPPSLRSAGPAWSPVVEGAKPPLDREGATNPGLRDLLARHFAAMLEEDPVFATRAGDHHLDREVPDASVAARERQRARRREFLAEARTIQHEQELDREDSVSIRLLIAVLEDALASESCAFETWSVSPTNNPLAQWNALAELHPIRTPEDASNLVERYRKGSKSIETDIENLRLGAITGLFGAADSMRRVVKMLERQLADPVTAWPMLAPAIQPHEGWTEAESDRFRKELEAVITSGVKPALIRYLNFLQTELLPKARGDDHPGLSALPIGKSCYEAKIREHTTLPLTAETLHALGEQEIARINEQMASLGAKLFGSPDLSATLARLRADSSLYFRDGAEIEAKARAAVDAASARLPRFFRKLPRARCVVARIPDFEAPFSTIAYYREPMADGRQPGQYFVNLYQPTTRPRYEAEALAYHEAIPGHHLQTALAQEQLALPLFRRYLGVTAFVEGWALYAEQLAEEMQLYTGDIDRMGRLSYESWRAARLVVDTGIHAKGWSRDQAKTYMLEHTALAPNNIDNEVDRYISWPGQALAYKIGQIEISRLRREAEEKLGSAFDVRAFHEIVLMNGAVSLPILGAEVEAWVASERSRSPR